MQDPTKIDFSKLLGFDMVAKDIADSVDFRNATIGAKLGAKIGKATQSLSPQVLKTADLTLEATSAGEPIMVGLGRRTVTGS